MAGSVASAICWGSKSCLLRRTRTWHQCWLQISSMIELCSQTQTLQWRSRKYWVKTLESRLKLTWIRTSRILGCTTADRQQSRTTDVYTREHEPFNLLNVYTCSVNIYTCECSEAGSGVAKGGHGCMSLRRSWKLAFVSGCPWTPAGGLPSPDPLICPP